MRCASNSIKSVMNEIGEADSKRDISCRFSPLHKSKREADIMDSSTPTTTRREVEIIPLDDESPIKWGGASGVERVESDSTSDYSGANGSQLVSTRTGISNEFDSSNAVAPYIEPSPETMDRRLAGAAMDITSGANVKQSVAELAEETVQDRPIGQNFYHKVMRGKSINRSYVGVKKLILGVNAPDDLLRSPAVDGCTGQKRVIPMEISSPLKKTKWGELVSDDLEGKQAALDYGNGSSPALKQREGVVNTTNVQAVHLPAPAECVS